MGVFFDGNRGWRTVDIGRRGRGHQTAGLERSPHWEHHVRPSAIEACYTRTCVPAAAKEDDTKSPSPSPQREPSLPPRCRHDLGRKSPMRAIAPATSRAFARLRTLTEYVRPSCRLLLRFSRIRAPFSVGLPSGSDREAYDVCRLLSSTSESLVASSNLRASRCRRCPYEILACC